MPSGFLMPEVSALSSCRRAFWAPACADLPGAQRQVLWTNGFPLAWKDSGTPGLPQLGRPHREAGQPRTPAAFLWASPSSWSAWAAAPPACSPDFTREPKGRRRAPRSPRSRRSGRPQEEQLDMALPLTIAEQVFLFPVRPSGCSSA